MFTALLLNAYETRTLLLLTGMPAFAKLRPLESELAVSLSLHPNVYLDLCLMISED